MTEISRQIQKVPIVTDLASNVAPSTGEPRITGVNASQCQADAGLGLSSAPSGKNSPVAGVPRPVKAGVLPATGLFQTAVFWSGLLFYAGLLFCGGAEFFLQGAASDDSVASRVEATVMCPASFPVLSEILAPEENGWPSLISGSPGQDALVAGEDSLECRQHPFTCRASYSLEVSLKYPVRIPCKVTCSDQTLPISLVADGVAQADDRKNCNIHSASSWCESGGRDYPDLFGQRVPDIRQSKAVDSLSKISPLSSAPLIFLKISTTLTSPSTGIDFITLPSTVAWITVAHSVLSATGSTIFPLSSSTFLKSLAISFPSVFPSISVPSSSPVTPLLTQSPGIKIQYTFPAIQVTFVTSTSPAFLVMPIHFSCFSHISITKSNLILEYSEHFDLLPCQKFFVNTSYQVLILYLSIPVSSKSQVYPLLFVSQTVSKILSFTASLIFQSFSAKDVHSASVVLLVYTSFSEACDIVCFVAMNRLEESMSIRGGGLANDLHHPEARESHEQPSQNTPEFCGGISVSVNGLVCIINWTIPTNELRLHPQGRPCLDRALDLWFVPKIIDFKFFTADSFTIIARNIWWAARVAGPNSIEDMELSYMDRISYGIELFDGKTLKLMDEIQMLAPSAKPLYEQSPIYADTRLVRDLLTGRLNTGFRSAYLDNPDLKIIQDFSEIYALSGYISKTGGIPDDNLIKLISTNGQLNHALQKAITGTHSDIVNYSDFFGTAIDDLQRLPEPLSSSAWMSEIDSLKEKSRNVSITQKPDGTLSIDSLTGVQRLPGGFSQMLCKQIFQRRREHLTWFALYPELKTDFIGLKESRINRIFKQISSEFARFRVVKGNLCFEQKYSDMLDLYISVSHDGFNALGSGLILSAAHLPKVLHPSRILQLWDIISVSSGDIDIQGAVDTLTPGDIYCVNRNDLSPVSLVYTLVHEDSHTIHLSLMDLSRMGSPLATWLSGQIRDRLSVEIHDLGDLFIWTAGGSKLSIVEDFSRRISGVLGTRLTGLIGAIDRKAWVDVDLPMIGVVQTPNSEFDDFVVSLISGGLEV
jgi:hypothetical protein